MFQRKTRPKQAANEGRKGGKASKNRSSRYEVAEGSGGVLGEGGMGSVYLAKDLSTNEPVAIKIPKFVSWEEVYFLEKTNRARKREKGDKSVTEYNNYVIEYKESFVVDKTDEDTKSLSKFKKPQIERQMWIIQEYCEYGDIAHIMRHLDRPFSVSEIKHIVANVILGLRFIHSRKIVHRDIKCLNILLTKAGRVKICDFGRAEKYDPTSEHDLFDSKVTDLWMAPEMFNDGAKYGYEVDIWALGISIIEMMTQKTPFNNLNGEMVGSNIVNLIEARLPDQRERLGLKAPPKDLVKASQGKNNNYRTFYESDHAYYERKNANRESSEDEEENESAGDFYENDIDHVQHTGEKFSKYKISMDSSAMENDDNSLPGFFGGSNVRKSRSIGSVRTYMSTGITSEKLKNNKLNRASTKTSGVPEETVDFPDDASDQTMFYRDGESKPGFIKKMRKSRKKSNDNRKKQQKHQKGGGIKTRLERFSKNTRLEDDEDELNYVDQGDNDDLDYGVFSNRKKKPNPERGSKKGIIRATSGTDDRDANAPISIIIKGKGTPKGLRKKKLKKEKRTKNSRKSKKKRSLVGQMFHNVKSSILIRKDRVALSEEMREQERAELEQALRKPRARKYSYATLEEYKDDVILTELVAWCLHTKQKKRPSALELCDHPFVRNQVRSLIKSERTDCGIREHSDFQMRADLYQSQPLRNDDAEEMESDDDNFLSPEQKANEKYDSKYSTCSEDAVCTCSESQKFIRTNVCDVLGSNRDQYI